MDYRKNKIKSGIHGYLISKKLSFQARIFLNGQNVGNIALRRTRPVYLC